MMLIEIGFRQNNLFISNSTKYFPTYCSSYSRNSHEINTKSRPKFFNTKNKNFVKRSSTMPYSEEGADEERESVSKLLQTIESDLDRPKSRHRFFNPFRSERAQKDKGKGKAPGTEFANGNRLAVEFPMIFNLGSVYSSQVVVYLDP